MSLVSLKCPSCGAEISIDDEKDYVFCSYCGSRISNDAIKKLKIEYSGDPMNVTNVHNVVNIDNRTTGKPNMIIQKPKIGRLIGGIILLAVAVMFLVVSFEQPNDPSGWWVTAIFAVIGIVLIRLYIRSLQLYSQAIKNAINNNSITNRE